MSVLESLSGSIADFLVSILSGISLGIDSLVYQLLGYAYNLFNVIASARVLSQDTLATLANRVYIIIGVIALFLVAYALLTAIIDPDKASKGDTSLGKIIPNIAIAIVAIALVPTIFTYAYRIQKDILCDNLIAKWILDSNPISSDDSGAYLATTLFQSFYYPKVSSTDEKANNDSTGITSEEEYNTRLQNITDSEGQPLSTAFDSARKGEKTLGDALGNFNENIKNKEIGYFMIVSTLAGGFCVYVLINYCFDAAKRAIKLAYLQLIAPLPILTIIIPGQKKIFQNWLKKTISCFTEIFVRIFVIVIVAFIAENLPNLVFNMSSMFNDGYGCVTEIGLVTALLVKALLILRLFAFAKEAPKLISDITGFDSKGFKLGISDRLKESGPIGGAIDKLGKTTAGIVTGAVGAGYFALRNKQNPIAAMKYGAAGSLKNKGKGMQFRTMAEKYYNDILNGKGKPSLLTGKQKGADQRLDAYRKAAESGYTDYRKNRYEQDSTYKGFYDAALRKERDSREKNYYNAKKNFNDLIASRDALVQQATNEANINDAKVSSLEQELTNYRNSKEYLQNLSEGKSKIDNYNQQISEAKKAAAESRRNIDVASHSYDAEIENADNLVKKAYAAYSISSDDYKKLATDQARTAYTSLSKDQIKVLSNGDKKLEKSMLQAQEDIDYVVKEENEKAAKKYANSLEGQKYAQVLNESYKLGGYNAAPGTSDKPGAQKPQSGSGKPTGGN